MDFLSGAMSVVILCLAYAAGQKSGAEAVEAQLEAEKRESFMRGISIHRPARGVRDFHSVNDFRREALR